MGSYDACQLSVGVLEAVVYLYIEVWVHIPDLQARMDWLALPFLQPRSGSFRLTIGSILSLGNPSRRTSMPGALQQHYPVHRQACVSLPPSAQRLPRKEHSHKSVQLRWQVVQAVG